MANNSLSCSQLPLPKDPLQICSTSEEAAIALRHYSFAILKTSAATATSLARATAAAQQFLESPKTELEEEDCKKKLRLVAKGNLFGFNIPSNAKRLFRAICSEWGASVGQPWPNKELKEASTEVATNLHQLLLECYDAILKMLQEDETEGQPSTKRPKLDNNPDAKSTKGRIPSTLKEAKYCPLDYFLYHGTNQPAVNCSEHKDRGVLLCVGLTNVPGLEVLPRNAQQFVCPEEHVLENTGNTHGLVCVMTGDDLKTFLSPFSNKEDDNIWSACVHRVKTHLKGPRLSITYEVRTNTVDR